MRHLCQCVCAVLTPAVPVQLTGHVSLGQEGDHEQLLEAEADARGRKDVAVQVTARARVRGSVRGSQPVQWKAVSMKAVMKEEEGAGAGHVQCDMRAGSGWHSCTVESSSRGRRRWNGRPCGPWMRCPRIRPRKRGWEGPRPFQASARGAAPHPAAQNSAVA